MQLGVAVGLDELLGTGSHSTVHISEVRSAQHDVNLELLGLPGQALLQPNVPTSVRLHIIWV